MSTFPDPDVTLEDSINSNSEQKRSTFLLGYLYIWPFPQKYLSSEFSHTSLTKQAGIHIPHSPLSKHLLPTHTQVMWKVSGIFGQKAWPQGIHKG